MRNTDIFSGKDGKLFSILSGTPVAGVDFITNAIRDFFKKEVAQVYLAFPLNGLDTDSILRTLVAEIEKKYAISLENFFFKLHTA